MKNIWKLVFSLAFTLCLIICFDTSEISPVINTENDVNLPILMYHKISENSKSWGKYCISPAEFENDIKLILKRGFTPITISDLENHKNGKSPLPEKPIMLTFDDGNHSDYTFAYPLALKYKIKFVSSTVGAYPEEYKGGHVYLSWEEMREMEKSGLVEFQNHSYNLHNFSSHRKGALKSSTEEDDAYIALISNDLSVSQKLFAENGLRVPTCFTYPFGMRDDTLLKLIKEAGFTSTLGTYARMNVIGEDLFDLKRFNREHNYDIGKILDLAE
ncbi:MAG: polysaccharide deacetylase family protein [Clostridia bacterium]|nr:polysaccharide deacetylase family protein [Clostridia bacterium]